MRQAVRLKNTDRAQSVTCRLDGPFVKDDQPQTLTILAGQVVTVDIAIMRCEDVGRRMVKNGGTLKELERFTPLPSDPKPLFSLS